MTYSTIQYQIDVDQVARVYLNKPDKHNALSPLMMQELIDVFDSISADETVRAVVLTGAGKSFCAGGDLKWMQSNLDKPRSERIAESMMLSKLLESINYCPKLVIARINGAAYGGGVGLISVCDIAIGLESAQYSLTEVKLGLVPANIAPYVLRKVGGSKMRRLALNAYRFDSRQACAYGFIDVVAAEGELDQAVEFELKLALSAGPRAISRTKQLISELQNNAFDEPAAQMVEVLADVWEGEEAQAGIRAFFAKTSPPWKRK